MSARRRLPEASRAQASSQRPGRHLHQRFDAAARHVRGAATVARHDAGGCPGAVDSRRTTWRFTVRPGPDPERPRRATTTRRTRSAQRHAQADAVRTFTGNYAYSDFRQVRRDTPTAAQAARPRRDSTSTSPAARRGRLAAAPGYSTRGGYYRATIRAEPGSEGTPLFLHLAGIRGGAAGAARARAIRAGVSRPHDPDLRPTRKDTSGHAGAVSRQRLHAARISQSPLHRSQSRRC